jgi:hypothetical protein
VHPDPGCKLTYRFFDRYTSEALIDGRDRLLAVLDDRARQGNLFEAQPAFNLVVTTPGGVARCAGCRKRGCGLPVALAGQLLRSRLPSEVVLP